MAAGSKIIKNNMTEAQILVKNAIVARFSMIFECFVANRAAHLLKISANIQKYTQIYKNVQKYTHKYTNIQIYINRYIYKDK